MKKRDRRRDAILKREYEIRVIRLNSYYIRKKRFGSILARAIEGRKKQIVLDENNGSNRFR